jgi:RNA polymerase sigma-54 factor
MKLLQVPTANLEERIQSELEENPALEMAEGEKEIEFGEEVDNEFDAEIPDDEPAPLDEYEPSDETEFIVDDDGEIADYKLKDDNYPEMDDNAVIPIKIETSFHELLTDQLGMLELDEREYTIAEQVLGSLDDDGYLRRALSSIADDLAFRQGIEVSEKEIEKIVLRIQDFDPAGIGARDLQECLLLQLKHKTPTEYVELAIDIIENQFDAFTKKHYDKLLQKYGCSQEQLKKAIEEIEKLNPKPGGSFTGNNKITENII